MAFRNDIVIISGPSGAGEDSIIDGLADRMGIERVITTTTREPRDGEAEGNPYYFISKDAFEADIAQDKFFEYAQHYNGNYYGVTYDEIERVKASEKLGIWKIDFKGVKQAKKLMPDIAAIFVIAPLEVLEQRIRSRSGVTEEYVAERMAYTREWLAHTDIYDFTVENVQGKLEETIDTIATIINNL